MSEETQESGLSTLKKTIIGIATTAVTAAGAYVTTHIEQIFGGGEEEVATEQVEQVAAPVEQKAEQNVSVEGPTINITVPQQQAAPTRVIERVVEKPVPAAPVKPVEDEDPW